MQEQCHFCDKPHHLTYWAKLPAHLSDVEHAFKLAQQHGPNVYVPHRFAVNDHRMTLLHWLVDFGCPKVVHQGLKLGMNPNLCDFWARTPHYAHHPPLFYAVRYGSVEVVQALLEAGAEPHLAAPVFDDRALEGQYAHACWKLLVEALLKRFLLGDISRLTIDYLPELVIFQA